MNRRQVIPRREHIPVGRENAITRAELAALWGMSDRDVRETIATMRIIPTDAVCPGTAGQGAERTEEYAGCSEGVERCLTE